MVKRKKLCLLIITTLNLSLVGCSKSITYTVNEDDLEYGNMVLNEGNKEDYRNFEQNLNKIIELSEGNGLRCSYDEESKYFEYVNEDYYKGPNEYTCKLTLEEYQEGDNQKYLNYEISIEDNVPNIYLYLADEVDEEMLKSKTFKIEDTFFKEVEDIVTGDVLDYDKLNKLLCERYEDMKNKNKESFIIEIYTADMVRSIEYDSTISEISWFWASLN